VIGLGRLRMENDSAQQLRIEVAKAAASGARVSQLPELLAMLPELHHEVVSALDTALVPQLRREHGEPIAAALDRLRERPFAEWSTVFVLLGWLGVTQDGRALPAIRRLLAHEHVGQWSGLETAAARAAIAVAGEQRSTILGELLAAPRGSTVAAALTAPELRTDPSLRAAAKEAILGAGRRLEVGDADDVFSSLGDEAVAFARDLLVDERFATVQEQLGMAALRAFGRAKSPDAVAVLARAVGHAEQKVRMVAAMELGNTFTRDAAPLLIELLKDRSSEVRKAAQHALEELARYLDAKDQWEKRLK
jgi:hypothetical protein